MKRRDFLRALGVGGSTVVVHTATGASNQEEAQEAPNLYLWIDLWGRKFRLDGIYPDNTEPRHILSRNWTASLVLPSISVVAERLASLDIGSAIDCRLGYWRPDIHEGVDMGAAIARLQKRTIDTRDLTVSVTLDQFQLIGPNRFYTGAS